MALWIASDFGKDKERCIVKAGVGLPEVPTVENWRSVRRMSLMDNGIGNISESPNCPELTTLLFQKNEMVNISGEFFKSMPMLVVLNLSHNRLFHGFPVEISNLVSLRYLDLSDNQAIKHLFAGLLELQKLIYLNMEGTGLTSVSGISNLSSLRTLRLRHNKMSRDSNVMEELQLLEHIEVLTIEICSIFIADQLVNAYREANAIQAISIRFIEEESILNLPDMAALSKLDMFRSGMVEVNVMRSTSSWNKNPTTPSFPNLSTVTLSYCHGLKDLTWLLFAPNLKALYVVSSAQVEDIISKEKAANILTEEVGTIIPFRKLEHFQVNSLPPLKSIYWNPLPFPRLRNFSIVMCPNLRKLPLDSRSGSSFEGEELVIHNGEQEWIDKVEWEDEATKELSKATSLGSVISAELSPASSLAFTHLCSCFGVEVNYVWNLEKNLAALEDTMEVLRARRADVLTTVQRQESEGLQRLNEVEVWLTSVENIQNQVYDLLLNRRDELEKLCICGLCTKNLSSSHSYGKRVFEMLKKVETIVGQEKMLKRAMEHLMDHETGIMGLYGMGGVGKTTLLEQINNKFIEHPVDGVEIVIFVVVSSELRVEMIQDEIAEKLGFRMEEWKQKEKRHKVTDLYARMKTMKFVLLLDDIWKEVDLKEIGVPFPARENGCKVVFTTRSREVCGQMRVDDPMEVKCLESNEAWDLFRSNVGKITLESHPDILELFKSYLFESLRRNQY
ncbi:unnamed protein product [Brassica oleracea]